MSWTSTIEDMVDRLNADLHLLERHVETPSQDLVAEARRLQKECGRMLEKAKAVREALGDPSANAEARVLELEMLLDQRNEDGMKMAADLARERELRQKAEQECAAAKKKVATVNGHDVKFGAGSGLVRSLTERAEALRKQNKMLRTRLFQLEANRKAQKAQKAQDRRRKKSFSTTDVVVQTKASRDPRTPGHRQPTAR